MRKIFLFLVFLIVIGCNKPRSVFICGDHVCVNKLEADQYFKENLTIEVKIIDKKKSKNLNLVELNLMNTSKNKEKILVSTKKNTKMKLKTLSEKEVQNIKSKLKKKNKIAKKPDKDLSNNKKKPKDKKIKTSNIINEKNILKSEKEIFDICEMIPECNIEEISKYLIKLGNKNKFPDISKRK